MQQYKNLLVVQRQLLEAIQETIESRSLEKDFDPDLLSKLERVINTDVDDLDELDDFFEDVEQEFMSDDYEEDEY